MTFKDSRQRSRLKGRHQYLKNEMKKEILEILNDRGEIIHDNYFGIIELDENRHLVYWVSQQDINELNIRSDDDPIKVRVNVATVHGAKITLPNSVLDYIPTTYGRVRNKEEIDGLNEFAEELRKQKPLD